VRFSKEEVLKILPHRDPFLFVDSVESVDLPDGVDVDIEKSDYRSLVGTKIRGNFFAREDLSFFKGHFPGNPVFPGVIMVEMMAQTSAFLMAPSLKGRYDEYKLDVLFSSLDKVKFRKIVKPGMDIVIESELVKTMAGFLVFKAKCLNEGQVVSEASFMAAIKIVKREK